jgi:hypothetical protein
MSPLRFQLQIPIKESEIQPFLQTFLPNPNFLFRIGKKEKREKDPLWKIPNLLSKAPILSGPCFFHIDWIYTPKRIQSRKLFNPTWQDILGTLQNLLSKSPEEASPLGSQALLPRWHFDPPNTNPNPNPSMPTLKAIYSQILQRDNFPQNTFEFLILFNKKIQTKEKENPFTRL